MLTTQQEEVEDYPFPLTLKQKSKGPSTGGAAEGSGANTPTLVNASTEVNGANGAAAPALQAAVVSAEAQT